MAELPSKVHLNSHPICLRIRRPSVYEDQNDRMWLHVVMDTGGDQQVWLCQVNMIREHNALTFCPLNSSTMPMMWMLHPGSQYLDSMGQFWRIVHHVKEDDMEEMILEMMDDS
ncbi:PREDICTED: T-cell leukemia/lymphoma protein 1A [Myotis brandtii]|nr:PREDICTED: T-cell leukemia/lymphoma protein 1A [Myotis brandtii]